MNRQKYINSDYRVVINHDSVYNGVKDSYTEVEIHFLNEELDCGNERLMLAFAETLKAAIRRSGKNTVEQYNKDTCVKDKYLKLYLTAGTDMLDTEEMLISACNYIMDANFDKSKEGKIYDLIFRYEDEIRECAYDVRKAVFTEEDFNRVYRIIVFSKMRKGKNNEDKLR